MNKYLELIRLPNVLTAACDAWAGYFIILAMPKLRGHVAGVPLLKHVFTLILVALAGCAFYAVGVIFNDIVDFDRDKALRPQRPLPSGRIALNVAFGLGALLAVAGMLLCMLTESLPRLEIGFALLACIVTYNIAAKRSRLTGPPFMAMCRALNVMLGMGLSIEMVREAPLALLAPAIMFVYIVALTMASFAEESAGMADLVVKWGVLGVALLDAIFLMAYGQMLPSLFCVALLAGAVWLSKKFAVA